MKQIYRESRIGGDPDKNKNVAIDECLFIHVNNNHIWVIGAIETDSRKLRLDIIPERNSNNIKTFILNHIEAGTKIITDGWQGYSFLDAYDSVWEHETHTHGAGDFGFGICSTSHMEHTWAQLKNIIKSIYNVIPNKNFVLYLRESEFRLKISKFNDVSKKLEILNKLFKLVYETNG